MTLLTVKTIALAAVLLGGPSQLIAADENQPQIGVGKIAFTRSDSVASFPVCKTSDDTARLYKLAVTAMAVFMDEHGCDFIPAGTEVTVEDFSLHGSFCVRQTGNPDCYWIPQEFLITPEVNQKWQENKESKVEAIKEFDKQHPECKGRETNLNLPEHCH